MNVTSFWRKNILGSRGKRVGGGRGEGGDGQRVEGGGGILFYRQYGKLTVLARYQSTELVKIL